MRSVQTTALLATIGCAAGSIWFLLEAGRNQSSGLLLALFLGWNLSPFVGLALANVNSSRWSMITRMTLYAVMFVIALASLAIYGASAHGILQVKVGKIFLLVPFVSWLLFGAAVPLAAYFSGGAE
jgi:hypothetical protein